MVVQAHAVAGQVQGGDGVQKAGGQAAQAAVAQGGLRLHGLDNPQVPAQVGQQGAHLVVEPQGQQVVAQQLAHKKLGGEVVELPLPLGGGTVLGHVPGENEQRLIELVVVTLVGCTAETGLGGLEKLFFQLHNIHLLVLRISGRSLVPRRARLLFPARGTPHP